MKALILICFALIFINLSYAVKLSPPKFDQDVCFVHSYPKGEPQEVTRVRKCPEGYEKAPFTIPCILKCSKGYVLPEGVRPDYDYCITPCPEGFKFNSTYRTCSRINFIDNAIEFFRGEIARCPKMHGKCRETGDGRYLLPYCTTSSNLDTTNTCYPERYSRDEVNPIDTLGCPEGLEKVDKFCYPQCDAGFESLGDICIEPCPKGYLRCGNVCTSGTSCENGRVQGLQALVYGIEELALKASVEIDLDSMMCSNSI